MNYYNSNKDGKKLIKNTYKKYNDLPNSIIKQIIEYKLNIIHKPTIKQAIKKINEINKQILRIEEMVENSINIGTDFPLFLDSDGKSFIFAPAKIEYLKNEKKRIVENLKQQNRKDK